MGSEPAFEYLGRSSLIVPRLGRDAQTNGRNVVRTPSDDATIDGFDPDENEALERLVKLKAKLQTASTHEFWELLAEELTKILGSQCTFISKRILVDEHDAAIEMPPLGAPGSCLMAVAMYLDNGVDFKNMYHNYRYQAFCAPCAFMKHEKVLIIPEKLEEIIPGNPNTFPWNKTEAYIGLPLFDEGKCFGHFGTMWSDVGAAKRKLGWTFMESLMHSLEDVILRRLLEGKGFNKSKSEPSSAMVVPLTAISASQSLKPYARSLSHELRTPMHGVVGMLDIMLATVQEAMMQHDDSATRTIFEELQKNIEVVQESSRRAIEAADNVVHAYDLGMQMPATPLKHDDVDPMSTLTTSADFAAAVESISPITPILPRKRNREESGLESSRKRPAITAPAVSSEMLPPRSPSRPPQVPAAPTKEVFLRVITESIETDHSMEKSRTQENGDEVIEIIKKELPDGQSRIIRLSIDAEVPDVLEIDEEHLQFSLLRVIHNAIKFTEAGTINIHVGLSRSSNLINIRIVDTGRGIDKESQQHIFKPHFQSDHSIARTKEGLGLSLFNAKAYVRKHLGGDITLERSDVEGPYRGTEFLVRFPLIPVPSISRASSPSVTPARPAPVALPMPTTPTLSPATPKMARPLRHTPRSSAVARPAVMRLNFNTNLAKDIPLEIMVAEDNIINRNILVGYLKKLGYSDKNITQACDGVEAVSKYEESLKRPTSQRIKAILMDLWMPNMDGYTATEKITELANAHGESLSIIAVTADITNQSQERAKVSGMTGFISKPYKVTDIQNIITLTFRPKSVEAAPEAAISGAIRSHANGITAQV